MSTGSFELCPPAGSCAAIKLHAELAAKDAISILSDHGHKGRLDEVDNEIAPKFCSIQLLLEYRHREIISVKVPMKLGS